ncbi:MAG: hypothetical protein ACREJC_18825, partial [Tepidisphaeraceae bacterium]
REIVSHVYLSGVTYTPEAGARGFMGITLNRTYGIENDEPDEDHPGVWVINRMPGLGAFPVLQDNDVILRVAESPLPLNAQTLPIIIQQFRAGQTIHLDVLRSGRVLHLAVTLSARPANIELPTQDFRSAREAQAEQYWEANFAPLVERAS